MRKPPLKLVRKAMRKELAQLRVLKKEAVTKFHKRNLRMRIAELKEKLTIKRRGKKRPIDRYARQTEPQMGRRVAMVIGIVAGKADIDRLEELAASVVATVPGYPTARYGDRQTVEVRLVLRDTVSGVLDWMTEDFSPHCWAATCDASHAISLDVLRVNFARPKSAKLKEEFRLWGERTIIALREHFGEDFVKGFGGERPLEAQWNSPFYDFSEQQKRAMARYEHLCRVSPQPDTQPMPDGHAPYPPDDDAVLFGSYGPMFPDLDEASNPE